MQGTYSNRNYKFSFIIPVFNMGYDLIKTLDSLARQDYDKNLFEIIIVDNNSTDDTLTVISEYCNAGNHDLDFTILTESKRGPSAARNNGIMHAKGEFLIFTDADVTFNQDYLKKVESLSRKHDVFGGPMYSRWDDIKNIAFQYFQFTYILNKEEQNVDFIATCNFVIKRNVLIINGIFFDANNEYASGDDSFFNYQISKKGILIRYIPDLIVFHEYDVKDFSGFARKAFLKGKGFAHFNLQHNRSISLIYLFSLPLLPIYIFYSFLFTSKYIRFLDNNKFSIILLISLAKTIHFLGLEYFLYYYLLKYCSYAFKKHIYQ
jgi:glycosyltransferase involved in cell wall biosynthesis